MEKLYSDSYLRDLDRPALQALCKKHGLKAMGKREALIKLLSRQVIPAHESIMKEISKRKTVGATNSDKKPVTASRRSLRNAPPKTSTTSADAVSENKPAVEMKDVLLAVEQNVDVPNPIVLVRSTDASEPRVQQEATAVGPQRSQRVSNRVNPLARPRAKLSRRSAASGSPALPIQNDMPEATQDVQVPAVDVEQEKVGVIVENAVEVVEVANEPPSDRPSPSLEAPQDDTVPALELTDAAESLPLVLRTLPEIEFPSIVGFHARRDLRMQNALAHAHDPARAQTPEPEELPGPGTTTPPGPSSPTDPSPEDPNAEWLRFDNLLEAVIVQKKKKEEVPLPQAPPPWYSRSGRKCRPLRNPASPRARERPQLVAALENCKKLRRMYRLLWNRVMRSQEAVFKASHPHRTFVWPAIPKELRPYPGEDPDAEDDSELFEQVYADAVKLSQLSPELFMEAHKLLLGTVDPSELAKVSDVLEVVDDEPMSVPEVQPQVVVKAEAQAPQQAAGAEGGPVGEDADAEGEPEDDTDMEEVISLPVPDEAELKRQQAAAKRRRAQIEAFQHMPEWEMPKFKRFVRHWMNAGVRQPESTRRHGGSYAGDVPLDLDAIAAPRRPPYFLAFNIARRGMSEADAFSLYADAGNGHAGEASFGDALDFFDDDEDMEDEDDDFDEECDEDGDEAMVVEPAQAFEPSQFAQAVDPSAQTSYDASNVVPAAQQVFEFPSGQQNVQYAAPSSPTIDPSSLFIFEQFSAQDGMVQHTQTADGAMPQQQQQQAVFNFDQVIFGDAASQGQQQEQQQYGMETGFQAQAPTPQDLLAQQQQQQQQQEQIFLTEQQQQELNALAASAGWTDFNPSWNVFDGPQMPMTPAPGATASFDDGGSFASSPAMTFDSNSSFDASSPFECQTPFDGVSFAGDTPMDVDSMITPEALQSFTQQWESGIGMDQYSQCGIQSPQPVHHQQIQLQPEPQQLVLPGDVQQYQSPAYDDPWPPSRPAGTAHQYDAASLAQWRPYARRYLKHARGRLHGFLLAPPEDDRARYFIEPAHRPTERSLGGWVRDIQFLMRREAPEDDAQEKWAAVPEARRKAPVGLSRFNPAATTQQN